MTKRIAYLISRFGVYDDPIDSEEAQEELVAIGKRAVPKLVQALDHVEHGWLAANTLFEIGMPDAKQAIPALLAHARDPAANAQMWAASALGKFGCLDELADLAMRDGCQYVAAAGFKHARPGAYAILEELIDRAGKEFAKHLADWLKPGSAAFSPKATDFDRIAAAAASKHKAIRYDAICALGDYRTANERKKAAPIIAGFLDARDGEARRLAAVQLGWMGKRATKDAIPKLRAMRKDPKPRVREAVSYALELLKVE